MGRRAAAEGGVMINAPAFQADKTLLERYGDGEWRECAAFRFVKQADGSYLFEVAKTLEEITAPEAS